MEDPHLLSYMLSYVDHTSALRYLLTSRKNYKKRYENKYVCQRMDNHEQLRLVQKYGGESPRFIITDTRNVYVKTEDTLSKYKSLEEICEDWTEDCEKYRVYSVNGKSTHHTHILGGDVIGHIYAKDEKSIKSIELCIGGYVIDRIDDNKLFPVLRQLYNMEGIPFYVLSKKILRPDYGRVEINIIYFKECESVLYTDDHKYT